jgi:hypothetical protein
MMDFGVRDALCMVLLVLEVFVLRGAWGFGVVDGALNACLSLLTPFIFTCSQKVNRRKSSKEILFF